MENTQEKKVFSTRDISLAATFVLMKFPMIGIDFQVEGQKNLAVGYFSFEDSQELREAEMKFWSGQLAVEPRNFTTTVRGLKARVNNVYKSPSQRM